MAKNSNLIITRSNYTVKEKHKKIADKVFYERDFMTTTNLGGYDSSVIPYGEGNFKFIYRNNNNQTKKRRHNYGNWLQAPDGDVNWTLTNGVMSTTVTVSEGKPKPEYKSLLDFCYFGSCRKLIENTVVNVLKNYPGELFVSYSGLLVGGKMLGSDIMTNPVIVENPYDIDIVSSYRRYTDNDLRYFFKSRNKYKIVNTEDEVESCEAMWDVEKWDKDCYEDGDKVARVRLMKRQSTDSAATIQYLDIYQYYYNGKFYLVTDGNIWSGYHIRPIDSVTRQYHESLGDFEKMMVNMESKPLHTMTLDYEYEDDEGIVKGTRDFTWPSSDGWNLDADGDAYEAYINSLLSLADYYDGMYSNNLWRMMVHESVKNMDYSHVSIEGKEDEYEEGISSFESLMLCCGSFFDDIKRDIDDMGRIKCTAYDVENSTSEQITEITESKGWEIHRLTDTLDDSAFVEDLYPNSSKAYDLTEMNKTVINYLNLNALSLMKQKGTRKCVESVLGLFGLTSYDYGKSLYNHLPESEKIHLNGRVRQWADLTEQEQMDYYDYKMNEFVTVASNTSGDVIDSEYELPIEQYHPVKGNDDKTLGLPVKIFYCNKIDTSGNTVEMKYMVPWFKRTMTDENGTYFQMYGGWEKMASKVISNSIAPQVTELYSDENLTIYDETINYIKLMDTLANLTNIASDKFYDGVIYYVDDISDISAYNTAVTDPSTVSNYLKLNDKRYCNEISDRGWNYITYRDIEQGMGDGARVLYLESIIDDCKGNNPHVGYSKYDEGMEYLEYFKHVFKYYIDNDLFGDEYYNCSTGELMSGITNSKFTLTDLVMDNVKSWFFTDIYQEQMKTLLKDKRNKRTTEGDTVEVDYGYKTTTIKNPAYVGKKGVENDTYPYGSELRAFNLETQEIDSYDEAAANSVINLKNMSLVFNPRICSYSGFKEYLYAVILKYVRQVIPSTTIWGVELEGAETTWQCFNYPKIVGVVEHTNN